MEKTVKLTEKEIDALRELLRFEYCNREDFKSDWLYGRFYEMYLENVSILDDLLHKFTGR